MRGLLPVVVFLCVASAAAAQSASAQTCPTTSTSETTVPATPPAINDDRMGKVQRLLSAAPQAAVSLGDSIMQGWPPSLLEKALGVPVVNAGFGMDRTQHTLWRLDNLHWDGQATKYVLLLVGTNNLGWQPCDVYAGEMTVVEKVHQIFPRATVIVTGVLPRGANLSEYDERIRGINALLRSHAKEHKYLFFDAHDAFLCERKSPCRLFTPGLLHLAPEGYDQLTSMLEQFVHEGQPRN